ncbi:MAG TPA: ferritin-like domain-containing protein [Sphingomonas sp.]|nr:ferritin-like domain-containing protein [Sphingomonas sp.]
MTKGLRASHRLLLRPIYRAIWSSPARRARKLLQFAEVEAEGGRDLVRASELTRDPRLRRRFLRHARDEAHHADLFRTRGLQLRAMSIGPHAEAPFGDWIAPGEGGLDDLRVEDETESALLAFLHLSETAAARDFAAYQAVLGHDPATRAIFERILRDEVYHMRYSRAELDRIAPGRAGLLLWKARLRRLWRAYLRLAMAIAGLIAGVMLTIQYFVLLPPFALLAKRAARRERPGWQAARVSGSASAHRQY